MTFPVQFPFAHPPIMAIVPHIVMLVRTKGVAVMTHFLPDSAPLAGGFPVPQRT
jgi:hypothetical protein